MLETENYDYEAITLDKKSKNDSNLIEFEVNKKNFSFFKWVLTRVLILAAFASTVAYLMVNINKNLSINELK
jgi:hypothetical protein